MESIEQANPGSPRVRYLSDDDVFQFAQILALDLQQTEVRAMLAENGSDVSAAAVSKMLAGNRKMIRLAMAWVEVRLNGYFERSDGEGPVRYWKLIRPK